MGNDKITVNDIYVMSAICAFCVANNYYNQPILMLISNSIGVTYKQIGNLPTIVQLAYAAGLLFLVPLGDKFNRKKLLQSLLFINLFASAAAFIATNFIFLENNQIKILQATANVVTVKVDFEPSPEFIDFKMQQQAGCYLIKDIQYDDHHSLEKMLRQK